MRRHPILWLLAGAYLLVVDLAASGAFTVLAQPAVLLLALVVGAVLPSRRRPAPARTRH